MLLLEEKVRLSPAYIVHCSLVKDEVNGWLRISEEVQQKIANKFGFSNPIHNLLAVNMMRRAHIDYNEARFREVSVYVRNNLANKGNLDIGDSFIDTEIYTLGTKKMYLSEVINTQNAVVISSSAT